MDKRLDTCTVPFVEDTMQQVEETCPSSDASPNERRGVSKMLKQLKERILASGPAIRKAFKKFKKAIKEGCVSVFRFMFALLCLLYVCSLFAGLILTVCFVIMGIIPWYIPAIPLGSLIFIYWIARQEED